MAETYCNLGNVARDQEDDEAADQWYRKALNIFEKKGATNGVIQLGKIAQHRGDFGGAEQLYRKALEIAKYIGNDEQQANCYARLGSLAREECDYEASKEWYEKALAAHEKRGAKNDAAKTCTTLGNLCLTKDAGKRRELAAAKKWFRKGLEIRENATWRDRLALSARLWGYRFLGLLVAVARVLRRPR